MSVERRRAALQRGVDAEVRVANALSKAGWSILGRNWRARRGELDVVAQKDGRLRFVEVRLRPTMNLGVESISPTKRRRLIAAAEAWLGTHSEAFDEVCFTLAVVVSDFTVPIQWIDNPFDGV